MDIADGGARRRRVVRLGSRLWLRSISWCWWRRVCGRWRWHCCRSRLGRPVRILGLMRVVSWRVVVLWVVRRRVMMFVFVLVTMMTVRTVMIVITVVAVMLRLSLVVVVGVRLVGHWRVWSGSGCINVNSGCNVNGLDNVDDLGNDLQVALVHHGLAGREGEQGRERDDSDGAHLG
jgi:hypothetical protein